jgi:hypothetical protein
VAHVVLIGGTGNTFTNLIGKPEARRSLEGRNLSIDWKIILRRMSKLVVTAE